MTIIDRYLCRTIFSTIMLAMLLIVCIDALFALVRELRHLQGADYTILTAIQYVLLSLPRRIYNMFPMAGLLGALMGLGLLAGNSELIIMRCAGLSYLRITASIVGLALLLGLLMSAVGEFVAPRMEHLGEILKATARGQGQAMFTKKGAWLRDGNSFIHINRVLPGGRMTGITRYEFGADNKLIESSFAKDATFDGKQWTLSQVTTSQFNQNSINSSALDKVTWDSQISPNFLTILISEPEDLPVSGLYDYIDYLNDNGLDSGQYKLIFWEKVLQPLSTMLMVLLAAPFIFGPLRASSMGVRILVGIGCGFGYYTLSKLFGPLSMVYHFPPIIAAALPLIVVSILAGLLYRKIF